MWHWSRRCSRGGCMPQMANMILPCIRRWRMTRKDSEKDTDRPHYYSQYWLDVAAGRAVINAPKVEEEAELVETDLDMLEPEPTPLRKASRSAASVSDGYKSSRSHSVIEPAFVPDELAEPEENELEQD